MTTNLNGIRVSRVNRTIFIPLPQALWVWCGKCQCGKCNGREAFWDTLAVSTQDADQHTWTVHAPELHNRDDYAAASKAYAESDVFIVTDPRGNVLTRQTTLAQAQEDARFLSRTRDYIAVVHTFKASNAPAIGEKVKKS